jgi:hypothetical protein
MQARLDCSLGNKAEGIQYGILSVVVNNVQRRELKYYHSFQPMLLCHHAGEFVHYPSQEHSVVLDMVTLEAASMQKWISYQVLVQLIVEHTRSSRRNLRKSSRLKEPSTT